jgi:hypothetical protein
MGFFKTSFIIIHYILQAFNPIVSCVGDLATKLQLQVKPVDSTVDAGAQVQQIMTIECIEDFRGKIEWRAHDQLKSRDVSVIYHNIINFACLYFRIP